MVVSGPGNTITQIRKTSHHAASKFFAMGMSVPELSRNPVIISEWGPSHTLCTMVVVSLRGRPCPVQPEELRLNPNAAPSVPEAEAVDLGGPL